jgi:CRP/FNR family transcriptional regulator, cyclic AMP receptor protein
MPDDTEGASLNVVERTLLLLDVSPFKALPSEELAAVVNAMTEQRFDAGETIFSDGDPEGRMYVVVEGAAELVQGGIVLRRVTRGMGFGVFGLLGIAAQDTARAVEPTHVLVLAREDFVEAVNDNPAFAVACLRGLGLWIQALVARVEALENARR